MKKVFMIGGTGLLGSKSAEQFIAHGIPVKTLALPPLPEGAPMPEGMEIIFQDVNKCSDEQLRDLMSDCDCLVYAAGVDERAEFPHPVYDYYYKYNIAPLKRLMPMAKQLGYESAVVFGSYFTWLTKERPDMKIAKRNPYMRSRLDQEEYALSMADDKFSVAVLELPYIFGTQPGRRPVWTVLINQIKIMDKLPATFYPAGGTAMLTVRQVGEACYGAATRTKGARAYPVSCYNMRWKEFLKIVYKARGMGDNRPVISIRPWMMAMAMPLLVLDFKKRGIESGMDPMQLPYIMDIPLFFDTDVMYHDLGVTPDDIEAAIADSIKVSVDVVEHGKELLGMKGEENQKLGEL